MFLRDRRGRRHFLVTVGADKAVDIKALELLVGAKGLSFASPQRLGEYLGLTPGSVTILGVINDVHNAVEVVIDEDLWRMDSMQCHPLVNTSTLIMDINEIKKFLELTGHEVSIIEIPLQK